MLLLSMTLKNAYKINWYLGWQVLIGSYTCWFSWVSVLFNENTGFSVSKAVYGAPLSVPGEFLENNELPSSSFLQKIKHAVSGITVPPPHHVHESPPSQLPPSLSEAQFVFAREDASIPSLASLYFGPYLVLEQRDKFFLLQLGSRSDVASVDRLKPAFSESPISAVSPPLCGRPALQPLACSPHLNLFFSAFHSGFCRHYVMSALCHADII